MGKVSLGKAFQGNAAHQLYNRPAAATAIPLRAAGLSGNAFSLVEKIQSICCIVNKNDSAARFKDQSEQRSCPCG